MPPLTTTAGHDLLARETTATYDPTPAPTAPGELPPALRELLGIATEVDQGLARMLQLLVRLQSSGAVETATGLQVESWLAQLGRVTRVDRSFLTTAAEVLAPMPATLAAFADGALSWSQIRGIVHALRDLRVARRAELDGEIAAAAHEFAGWDPEQIVWRVELLAAEALETDRLADAELDELLEDADRPGDVLVLQPRIDGTGGKLYGDYHDPVAFGTIENALSETMGTPDALEPSVDDAARARNADRLGQARADALVDLCADALAGRTAGDGDTGGRARPAKPMVLATVPLETLLGLSHQPGHLLTRMTGGRLRVDAATARRLVDEGGAGLRTIVIDDVGRAVGVGKKTYVPPGWLRETLLALQPECSTPGCRVAARLCDLDHIDPFPRGPTDVDNVAPECRRDHGAKGDGHWKVTVLPDGTRRWTHARSGLTTDVPLATRSLRSLPSPELSLPRELGRCAAPETPLAHAPPHQPPKPDPPGRRP